MTAPLLISFDVDCPADHAFKVWTSKIGTWWPRDHTVSGDPDDIVLESGPGGRIYERTSTGERHEWGEVTGWEPPRRLSYLWHIGRERATATEVEITFVDQGAMRTRIEIVHSGWDKVGEDAQTRRDQNRSGWDALVPRFMAAVGKKAD
jgi:Activator of Hsp90 ATPase homolog 1-like protein